MTTTRRDFLRYSGAVTAALPTLGSLTLSLAAMNRASAAFATDYKALVAIFLYGGCDNYNQVLRTDGHLPGGAWYEYNKARGGPASEGGIALEFNKVRPVFKLGTGEPDPAKPFGWHPELCGPANDGSTGVQYLFDQGRLAVVTNVGPLIQPTSQAQYSTPGHPLPPKLFSHNDQQSVWQTMADENAQLPGWGGVMADRLPRAPEDRDQFTCISVHGHAPWLVGMNDTAGNDMLPYQMVPVGAVRICGTSDTLFGSEGARDELLALIEGARTHIYQGDLVEIYKSSIAAEAIVNGALPPIDGGHWSFTPDNPGEYEDPSAPGTWLPNPLASELQLVARMIKAARKNGSGLDGMRRQLFLVGLEGFDTHNDHLHDHADGLAKLSHGLAYFDKVLGAMGISEKVTTFTASDFGRAMPTNGNGCDHGWGGHYFVMGGAVDGGKFYGDFPLYGSVGADGYVNSENQVGNGVLLPARSVEQYAATLGKWLGLADADLDAALPKLVNWNSQRDLGFMKP